MAQNMANLFAPNKGKRYEERTFQNEYTEYVYDIGGLECVFVNSDEFREFPEEDQKMWNNHSLLSLVYNARYNERIKRMFESFCSVSADYIGISEGEEFCNIVGFDDLYHEIYDTFWNI